MLNIYLRYLGNNNLSGELPVNIIAPNLIALWVLPCIWSSICCLLLGTVVIQEICLIYCISETSHTIPYLEICLVILPKEDYQCKSNIAVITLSTDDLQTRKHLIASLLSKKWLFPFLFRNVIWSSINANNLQDG